jgi:hypothetical protein
LLCGAKQPSDLLDEARRIAANLAKCQTWGAAMSKTKKLAVFSAV